MSNNSRLVPVPDRCQSAHAVLSADPAAGTDIVEVPSPTLLRHFGSSQTAIDRLADRRHGNLILTETDPQQAGRVLIEARQRAIELADAYDGVVLDLSIPRIVEHRAPEASLSHAAQWVAMDLDNLVLRSRGLEAFGLPELLLDAGTPAQTPVVLAIAMGVAHRLIDEWPAVDPVGPAEITLRDIAHAYADPAAATSPVKPTAKILISYTDGHLAVSLDSDPAELFA